ncbi:hypothetical protein H2200_012447 [Cladophialophora chaetospira]|uniref:Enoyl reductase (ER) domain-containing protein n=1 Tax=Cladophialophora chaetospira TaxID=386627 RepID=A0AA38WXY7_9EURO|nr:hypothetical protein H2200_012447 [Cladophialophora chaetospira]
MATSSPVTALQLQGAKQLRLSSEPSRTCGPKEVRVKIAYCGICGSDIHEYQAAPIFSPPVGGQNPHSGLALPVTLGHEFSGLVTEVGSAVVNIAVGQKVVVDPVLHDRHYGLAPCDACQIGLYNVCRRATVCGLSAPGGGLASETIVMAASCIPLPSSLSLKVGALVQPLTIAWHAVRISGFKAGQKALVCGAGPIGLAMLMALKAWGASTVIVSEITGSRSNQATRFGADVVVNPLKNQGKDEGGKKIDSVKSAVERATNGDMVDVAFVAASHQSVLDTAIAATRIGGTVLNAAINEKPLQVDLNDLTMSEKKLLTSARCTDEDWVDVIAALENKKIPAVEDMITAVVPLSNAIDGAFKELIDNTPAHIKILIQPDG